MSSLTPNAIAVILTALDIEIDVVSSHLQMLSEEVVHYPSRTRYRVGLFNEGENNWVVVIAKNGKRNVNTAILTERAINYFDPDTIMFVGCAGGLDGSTNGDVVAASDIVDYESGAETKKGFEGANQGSRVNYRATELLGSLDSSAWKERVKISDKPSSKLFRLKKKYLASGKLHIKPIASGEKTQKNADSTGMKHIAKTSRDAAAVETEGHGFLTAAHMNSHSNAIILRGISDEVTNKDGETDKWTQPFSVECATAVALEFLSRTEPEKKFRENYAAGISRIYELLRDGFSVEACPYPEDTFESVELDFGAYTDAGFFAEAIAAKVSNRNPEAMDKSVLCEIVTLCQKAGYGDMAWRFIYEGLLDNGQASPQVKAHTYLMALKLFSQQANKNGARWVVEHYEEVGKWVRCTSDKAKIPTVYSRAGVAYALLDEKTKSKECFERALTLAEQGNGNNHQLITIGVLWAMAAHFRGVEQQIGIPPLDRIIAAQTGYLTNETSLAFAQAYPLKSSVQCLFAEAAMLLTGQTPENGYLRLAAASVMRRKAYAHPYAEGFAELIALVRDEDTKELLRFTMDPAVDVSQRREIQPYLKKCSSLSELFSFGMAEWGKLRTFLEESTAL